MNSQIKSALLLSSFPLILGACTLQDYYGPSPIPRGYVHYDDEYKTVIPKRPFFIGEEYSDADYIESERLWEEGINRLITELEQNSAMNGLSISVQPARLDNSFDVRMDYYLRKILKQRGYLIVTEALDSVPVLRYKARLPGYEHGLQQKGRQADLIDDIQKEFDVKEEPHNDGRPFVFLGLGIYDVSKPRAEQELVFVEVEQPLHRKDLHEIRDSLIDIPEIKGMPHTSNRNK